MAFVLLSSIIIIIMFVLKASLFPPTMAAPRTDLLAKICGDVRAQDETKYMRSYAKILLTMQRETLVNKFATGEDGETPNRIFVLGQCMDDLSLDDCDKCFSKISSRLIGCFPFTAGRVFLDGCFMRFDNYSFYEEIASEIYDVQRCSDTDAAANSKEYAFSAMVLIDNLVEKAPMNKGFADEETKTNGISVYGMASCWKSLDSEQCNKCLINASDSASLCLPSEEGRALNTGCFLRYSSYAFSNKPTALITRDAILLYMVYTLGAVGTCLMAVFIGFFVGKIIFKKRLNRQFEEQGLEIDSLATMCLRFKYSTLQKATEDFKESHKIGQGGYGEVFKGALADGREIAIKRLFVGGKCQIQAVCNEIDIICQAQHKNLVRLLGCCFTNDSLLVYEFLANGSLDRILFDPEKKKELDWKKRLGIIIGTAKGLEYLHKDCQVRVVHRDIKASNILLDWKYRPKIADFGLARFYSSERIVANTAIVGTLGYMAPEYLAQGRLTEKVDVYSYGVLVLEVVSGVQNNKFHSEDTLSTLVTTTWRHFQENTVAEIIDKSMEIEDVEEVQRIVQIGLLCTQESPALRPTMTNVVEMLKEKNVELPTPSKPPFTDDFSSISSASFGSSRQQHRHLLSVDSCNKYLEFDHNDR
ncbi:hypothetical protein CsSME_00005017 [Camellia sinensis var. sinensis]|uniref:Protein kinase domain-containing protein n=2 Tax=Camellia sinensis TaxID=4442 RepID=A0A7J7I2N5_CAMSI|nr:putative cysteine-rich receptor-like protein kinase 43 isoform X1 [Camellia sinensis]KAF5958684.1 hypothetical protein HYC85_005909 [Camellia sinensis]THF97033.1 hypothetical protein TEA_020457 [Camellia sinensis var. sinensis]